jgi:hypothetical protein
MSINTHKTLKCNPYECALIRYIWYGMTGKALAVNEVVHKPIVLPKI